MEILVILLNGNLLIFAIIEGDLISQTYNHSCYEKGSQYQYEGSDFYNKATSLL